MATQFIKAIAKRRNAEAEQACTRRGYYLVKNGARHFISVGVNEAALNRVADKVLSEKTGWDYWVDFCYGPSVTGAPAWSNVDHTDSFI